MAVELIQTDTVLDDAVLEIENTIDVITAVVSGTTYVFASGQNDDGISVFKLSADGTLTNTDNVTDFGDLQLFNVQRLATVESNGFAYLVAEGNNDSGVSVFLVGADGVLTNVDNVTDAGALELGGARGVTTAAFGNDAYVFVAGGGDDGISTFSLGSDGTLTNLENFSDNGTLSLNGAHAITTAVVNSITYLFVAGEVDGGISVFSVDPADGSLANVFNIADTGALALASVYEMTTARVGGVTYLFAGGASDYGLSVFSVGADGVLTEVDSIFGLSSEFFPRYPTGMKVIDVDGTSYLVVGSSGTADIRAFSIADDGTLTKAELGGDDLSVSGLARIATAEIDGVTYVVAGGTPGSGGEVTVFRADHNIIDETAMAVDVGENETAVTTVAQLYTEDTIAWSITGGADAALLTIDPVTGAVSFLAAPDFEAPGDDDGDNVYEIEVTADDGIITEMKAITVTVTDLNDEAPVITSNGGGATAAVSVAEGEAAVTTVTAVDPDSVPGFAIAGGADAALFVIDPITGALAFAVAPDFEVPDDADSDNVYEVVVEAGDGTFSDTQALSVTVTDIGGQTVTGGKAKDTLTGTDEADTILGKNGKDSLSGLAGTDLLDGGKQKDTLTGGADADQFRFSTKLKDKWADKIIDFTVGEDLIALDQGVFGALGGTGGLKAKFFDTGKTADSGKDRILYQENKGWIRYDADGKGGDDAVKVAKVGKGLDLSEDDFLIV